MPAEGIHLTALAEAIGATALATAVRRRLVAGRDAARLGALLVDLPYFDRFALEVVRYALGVPARPSPWGAALHEGGAIALLDALLAIARRERDDRLGAIALGLASHAAIDRALHPLVNALARRFPEGKNHDASHREVEKFQSICFHEAHLGRDLMGSPAITGHLTIELAAGLGEPSLARQLGEAFTTALGRAPAPRALAAWGRGYRAHTRLLGTPLGRRIAPPAVKDAARPRFLHGAWGDFATALAAAVRCSLPVIDAAGAVLDADDADLPAARAALAAALPAGTIDPAGEAIDLARAVSIALPAATATS